MRRSRPIAMLLPLVLLLGLSCQSAWCAEGKVTGGKVSSHPAWFKESFLDIAADVEEAAEADRHVILFMEMNGCPYCYKMLKESFEPADRAAFVQEHFDVIALNVRGDREVALDADTSLTEKALAERFDVRFTPTVVFLSSEGQPVARVSGYRNPDELRQVLDYVAERAYGEQTLAAYLEGRKSPGAYSMREHPAIGTASDLAALTDKPLAVLFEDAACLDCDALHDGHLKDPEVLAALGDFRVVRLDALSDEPITAPDGSATTPRKLAADLGITYRPSLVLYDGGREIARIASMLYRYHFIGLLEYVGQGHYKTYPASPFDYINAKTAELTAKGQDVSIADE